MLIYYILSVICYILYTIYYIIIHYRTYVIYYICDVMYYINNHNIYYVSYAGYRVPRPSSETSPGRLEDLDLSFGALRFDDLGFRV